MHTDKKNNDFFIVCHTKEDVLKARKEYFKKNKIRFKVTLAHCIFQRKYQTNGSEQKYVHK